MNKIIKCNLGVQYVAEDADAKNIYVTIIYPELFTEQFLT